MDLYNSNNLLDSTVAADAPVYHDFDRPKYAEIYKIKYASEFVYVFIEFYGSCPSYEEFLTAGKLLSHPRL